MYLNRKLTDLLPSRDVSQLNNVLDDSMFVPMAYPIIIHVNENERKIDAPLVGTIELAGLGNFFLCW
jgi:hypothetical protein